MQKEMAFLYKLLKNIGTSASCIAEYCYSPQYMALMVDNRKWMKTKIDSRFDHVDQEQPHTRILCPSCNTHIVCQCTWCINQNIKMKNGI